MMSKVFISFRASSYFKAAMKIYMWTSKPVHCKSLSCEYDTSAKCHIWSSYGAASTLKVIYFLRAWIKDMVTNLKSIREDNQSRAPRNDTVAIVIVASTSTSTSLHMVWKVEKPSRFVCIGKPFYNRGTPKACNIFIECSKCSKRNIYANIAHYSQREDQNSN